MTDDEIKQRAQISAEVFDDKPAAQAPEPDKLQLKADEVLPVEQEPKAEDAPVDEWAGVNPALRKTVEALQARASGVDQLEFRLKQTEQRLGAATNEISELKKKPEPVKEPTDEKTKQFRAEYEELSGSVIGTIDERIAAMRAEVLQKVPTIDDKALAETIAKTVKAEIAFDIAVERVEEKHPGWQAEKDTPEFKQWQKTAPADVSKAAYTALDAIRMMDAWKEHRKSQKSPAEIEAARLKRLEQSQTTPGRKLPAAKAESDMTEAELRAHIAAQVFK